MSWLASIGQRAREAAGAVGNVGVTARAALNSVTSFADDRARRIGQALHARVTGRGHSIDDAVVRVERAVVECVPAQRPAMLRRWLAALRASSSAPSAPSNDETEAKASSKEDVDTSNESSAAESSKESSDSADSSGKEKEWASLEVAEKEKPDAARAGGEQDVASTPGGLANAPSPINAFGLLDAGGVGDAALTFFEEPSTLGAVPDDPTVPGSIPDDVESALTFRDVVLRSKALEKLADTYVDAPSSGDVETALFVELLAQTLMIETSEMDEEGDDDSGGSDAMESDSSVNTLAVKFAALQAAAADAVRAHDAEVQLGDAELRAMLTAAVGSAKKVAGVEALYSRERALERELVKICTVANVGGELGGLVALLGCRGVPSVGDESAVGADESSESSNDAKKTTPPKSPGGGKDSSNGFAAPELAAATRRAVDVARRAHESASARAQRLDAEHGETPTAEASRHLRSANETLERASADVANLSKDSSAQLAEATRFRAQKSAELAAAEASVVAEADRLATRTQELREELARVGAKADDAAKRARLASEEKREFEEGNEAVRATLELKVADLTRRAGEYGRESAAVVATGEVLAFTAQLRHDALIKQRASAANDEVVARRRYVAAVCAHASGQAGAMRLCLDRLAFCASELSEQRAKRAKARTLGLGADVEADLSSTCATIERKYLEAEEGMNAVLAAGAALRWEAERVAPEALKTAVPGSSPAGGELISVFEEAASLRDAFTKLERPSGFFNEEAVGGAMAAAAAEAGVDGFALGAGIPAVIQELPEEASTVEEKYPAAGEEIEEEAEVETEAETETEEEVKADDPSGVDVASPLRALELRDETVEPEPEAEVEPEPALKAEAEPEPAPEVKPEAEPEVEVQPAAEPELEVEPAPEVKEPELMSSSGFLPTDSPGAPAPPHPPAAEEAADADGWLSDVSESKDDDDDTENAENTHDWADTSVEVAEETPRADA